MKRILIFLLACLPLVVAAQTQKLLEINQSSFRPVHTDALSGVAIDKIAKDPSQRPCARIKMHINRMTTDEIRGVIVRTIGGNVVLTKQIVAVEGNGLIIEMTAKEQTRFYIHHDKYGDSNEVSLNLEGNKEYRIDAQLNTLLHIAIGSNIIGADVYVDNNYKGKIDSNYTLTIGEVTPGAHKIKIQHGSLIAEKEIDVNSSNIFFRIDLNQETARPQYVVFQIEPKEAIVVVDGKKQIPDAYGIVKFVLNNGSYSYDISAKDHHNESGTFVVDGKKVEKIVSLRPAYGYAKIPGTETLRGANIFIDGVLIGQAPVTSGKLSSGVHSVSIVKDMYKSHEGQITISDNQTTEYAPILVADFANVSLTAGEGFDIYINNEYKSKSSWSGVLATGSYIFEARREGYRSTTLTKEIVATSARQSYALPTPTPILGSINIDSTPAMADVYVDGKLAGRTPLMQDIIIGKHEVVLRKGDLVSEKQSVNIVEGQMANLNLTLVKQEPPKPMHQTYIENIKGLNMKMIYVEGGTFQMGSNGGESGERPVHSVTLDSYYIAETEVTNAQWYAVMGTEPSSYSGSNRPVESVTWYGAQKFCEKLSELTGKRYVLPTEAQWEYAARGGNKSKGYTYSGSNDVDAVAKYGSSSGGHNNVKSKQPNELGIYDMSGNVWEWCSDWRGDYSSSSQTNPKGPSSGSYRVLRGGSWGDYGDGCRVADRYHYDPSDRSHYFGFRIVCIPSQGDNETASNAAMISYASSKKDNKLAHRDKNNLGVFAEMGYCGLYSSYGFGIGTGLLWRIGHFDSLFVPTLGVRYFHGPPYWHSLTVPIVLNLNMTRYSRAAFYIGVGTELGMYHTRWSYNWSDGYFGFRIPMVLSIGLGTRHNDFNLYSNLLWGNSIGFRYTYLF